MKKTLCIIFTMLTLLSSLPVAAPAEEKGETVFILDNAFYYQLYASPLLHREAFLEQKINLIVRGQGIVKVVDRLNRYRKQYRAQLEDGTAQRYKMTVLYNVFFDNEDSLKMINKSELFEFKGQFMSCTPLNTNQSAFIIDIVLEEGAIVIE